MFRRWLWVALLLAACWAWGQSLREGLPEPVAKEINVPHQLPQGRYIPAREWEAEGREAGHGTGRAVSDPDASGGRAWESKAETGAALPYLLYGPYVELEPGDYVAFFRIKLMGEADEDTVAQVDVCVDYAQNILRSQDIAGSDLALNRYVQFPLAFRYPGGKLECRAMWTGGYAPIRVDRIALFRLEGGKLDDTAWKVPQPVTSGLPQSLPYRSEPRPFHDVFPRSSAPAKQLLVCDLRRQTPDRQLMALTLQGIVNRAKPQIYCLFNETDSDWLKWMIRRKWIQGTQTVSSPEQLLMRFRGRLKGMVITDAKLPATKNIATMIAGVREGIVVTPRLAKKISLPVLDDLRGRWTTSAAAYRWAFDKLWSRLNHHVIACSWPDHLGLRDYLVQHRIFIFWLSGPIDGAKKDASPDAEVRLMEELLAKMPVNIPVMSYPWAGKEVGIGEGPGVTLFAEFGKYLVGSINCSNLSVHSGIQVRKFRQKTPPLPQIRRDKIYVSWIISDGDNLPVLTVNNFPQIWKDPLRGQFPIGWTISPAASLLIPDIADYYYSTATPQDCFMGAVSGVGYTYPDSYGSRFQGPASRRIFDEFLDQTRLYMDRMDLKAIWIMGISRPGLIRRYAEKIPSLEAIFPDYGRRVRGYDEATYPTSRRVPVFHALTGWQEGIPRERQIENLVEQVRAYTPQERPAFLHLFVLNWFADLPMLREVLSRLGTDYIAVRPDHLAALYRQDIARRQVLIRAPSTAAAIEGQEVLLTALLYNATSHPLNLHAKISGLHGASLHPVKIRLAPRQEASLSISGIPSGDRLRLAVKGPFGTRSHTILLRRVSLQELASPVPGRGKLRFAEHLETERLPHRSGKEETDPSASGKKVRSAIKGETDPGYIVFGPYAPLKAGQYLALFRLKRTGGGSGIAAVLDTCVGGGNPVTASKEILAANLPEGKYRSVPLLFRHPGGAFETRVLWPGNVSLAVDSISLWEVAAR